MGREIQGNDQTERQAEKMGNARKRGRLKKWGTRDKLRHAETNLDKLRQAKAN